MRAEYLAVALLACGCRTVSGPPLTRAINIHVTRADGTAAIGAFSLEALACGTGDIHDPAQPSCSGWVPVLDSSAQTRMDISPPARCVSVTIRETLRRADSVEYARIPIRIACDAGERAEIEVSLRPLPPLSLARRPLLARSVERRKTGAAQTRKPFKDTSPLSP